MRLLSRFSSVSIKSVLHMDTTLFGVKQRGHTQHRKLHICFAGYLLLARHASSTLVQMVNFKVYDTLNVSSSHVNVRFIDTSNVITSGTFLIILSDLPFLLFFLSPY